MSNFFVKKILEKNLTDVTALTNDVILNITDAGNLYINTKQGKNLKISDIIFVESKTDLDDVIKTNSVKFGKLYVTKDELEVYIAISETLHESNVVKFVNLNDKLNNKVDNIDKKLEEIDEKLNAPKEETRSINVVFHIPNKLNMAEIKDVVYADDLKRKSDDICRINNIQIMTSEELTKDIKMSLYLDDMKVTDIPLLMGTKSNIVSLSKDSGKFTDGILHLKVEEVGNNPDNVHIIVNVEVKNINK